MAFVNNTLVGAIRVDASIEGGKFIDGARKIRAETGRLEGDVKKRFGNIGKFAAAGIAGLVGALSVSAFVQVGRAALKYAADLGEVAQQLGVTTRDLQTFRYAASQLGVDQSVLDRGLAKLTETLGKVAAGAERPARALEAIGLNAQEIARLDTGEAMRRIADALSKVENRAQRAAVEVAIFGESGSKLDVMLAGGSKSLNELAVAAERLGIVLSDEQIQKADETADKLDALKKVLEARIAGIVADNADAILGLADSIEQLVRQIQGALPAIRAFYHELTGTIARARAASAKFVDDVAMHPLNRFNPLTAPLRAGHANRQGVIRQSRLDAQEADWQAFLARSGWVTGVGQFGSKPPSPKAGGGDIPDFLGRQRRGGRARKDRSAEEAERKRLEALREANRFDQQIRRAKMDVLQATRDLATDAVERYAISIQIKDAERAAFEAQLRYEVAAGEMTQVQADQLQLEYDRKDQLERDLLIAEENARAREDSARLDQVTFDVQRDALEAQLQLADTAQERRDLELRLLDLAYRQERARLEAVIADEQSSDLAKEEARRRLAGLNATFAADRQGVLNRTRGPLEDFFSEVPRNAAEAQEAMERLQVMGIDGAINSIIALSQGFESFRDTAINAIQQVIAELIRMQLMKLALNLIGGASGMPGLGSAAGSSPIFTPSNPGVGFARGGSFDVLGRRGIDKNVLSLNGLPMANVSFGERISVANDMGGGRSGAQFGDMHFHFPAGVSDREARRTGLQAAGAFRSAVARAIKAGVGG